MLMKKEKYIMSICRMQINIGMNVRKDHGCRHH